MSGCKKYFLSPDRPGLRNVDEIRKLNEAVGNSLAKELSRGPAQQIKEEIPAISLLINKRHTLRYVGGGERAKGDSFCGF